MLSKMFTKATVLITLDSLICSTSSRSVSVIDAICHNAKILQADDPNGGYVDYKDEADAFGSFQLASVNGYGQAFLGVDHAQYFNGTNARGRPALRIQSTKLYNGGLFIADIAHMPGRYSNSRIQERH
jgi:hypothetical protein